MNRTILSSAVAIMAGAALSSAQATTLTFDEVPATNNSTALSGNYQGLGATFSATNTGIWGGLGEGDPGGWGLRGTNGTQFLGFNGSNNGYAETVNFASAVSSVSFDASRSDGSSDGTITLQAFDGAALVGTDTVVLGDINTWSTLSLSAAAITSITWTGTGTDFHPYGVDNFQFAAVPEPAEWALVLAGFGGLGASLRTRRRSIAA